MGKHKQTKRERKFGIKGGVKARLENGGTIVSKGKKKNFNKKRKNASQDKEVIAAKLQKRAEKQSEEYQQQLKALRDAEDFTGRNNLGDLDVNSFFTSLEEELKGGGDALLSSSDEEEIGGDPSDEEEQPKSDSKQKKKEGSESGSDSESDDSDSEEKEDPPSSMKAKTKAKSEQPAKSSNASKADNNDKKKKENTKEPSSSSSSSSNSSDDDDSRSSEDSSSDDKPTSKKQIQNKAKQAESKPKQQPKTKKSSSSSGSDDSDSDDDDIEAAEARMKAEMKKLESQDPDFHEFLKENEQSLLEFGEEDEEEEGADQAMEEEEDDEMDDEEKAQPSKSKNDDNNNKKKKGDDDNTIELTHKMLHQMSKGAFYEHGIKSLKKLLKAYKSACRVATNSSEDPEDDMAGSKDRKKKKKARQATHEKTYRIESSKVFDQLMVTCLGKCHEAFYFHLLATDEEKQPQKANRNNKKSKDKPPTKGKNAKKNKRQDDSSDDDSESDSDSNEMETEEMNDNDDNDKEEEAEESLDEKPLDPKVLERSEKWVEVKPLLNLFLRSTLHLISESKEPDLLAIVLKSLDKYVRYMTPFPRLAEALLKTLVGLWSAPLGDASADYQVVRLNAFLRIRQLALTQPFPFIETCLKKTYLAYARRAKFGGDSASVMSNTLPTLTFMGNCLVELYSLDHASSYQHAFVYIRQLALLLRAYMQKKTKEAAQQVFCWQFLHCLKLWVAVLATCCKQVQEGGDGKNDATIMRELVYPLTEIILGVCRFMPAPARYVPLRFHCVRLCQQLAAAAEKFIPTTSLLMPVLDLKEVNIKPKKIKSRGANTRGVQLQFLLRLPKDDPLRTAEEQEAVMAEIFKLLNRELDLYRYSPGFPEFQFNVNQRLKKFIKNTKNSRWRAYARGSVDMCERYMDFAVTARSKLTVAPKDVKTLECIRPAREPSMGDRYAAAVEKENKEWTSLISATSTTTTPSEAKKETNDADDDVEQPKKKKAKRSKQSKQPKPSAPRPPAAGDDDVMDIEDTVEEGVEWSDEDA